MDERTRGNGERYETEFHPIVYGLLAAAVLWVVVAAWLFFGVDTYAGLMLVVVTFTALGFLAVPWVFWRLSGQAGKPVREPLYDWAGHRFEVWGDRLRGRDAAINALIAPVAAGITLTLAGLVAWLVLHGGS